MLENLEPQLREKSLSALCKICGHQALLPKSIQIPLCYDRSADAPLYSGGYADVWKGEHKGSTVAVKVLRIYATADLDKIMGVGCSLRFSNRTYRVADCDSVGFLQRSDNVEKSQPSKRTLVVGCNNERQGSRNGIRMDVQWEYKRVH